MAMSMAESRATRYAEVPRMLTQPFEIERTNDLIVAAIRLEEITLHEAQELVVELIERMRYENARFFILDMSNVTMLVSDSLSGLITFAQDLECVHGRVALANCRPSVASVFQITGLDTLFALYDDVETAIEEVTGG